MGCCIRLRLHSMGMHLVKALPVPAIARMCVRLETFPVDDGGSTLVVFMLGDPHLLEGREGGHNGASDPHRVLPLWRRDDLDLNTRGRQGHQFLLHSVRQTCAQKQTLFG